jgi:hypothetical protein
MAFLLARVGPKGAAGAAAGLASLPALAECRAATASGPVASPARHAKNGDDLLSLSADGSSSQQEAWLAPEFKDGEYLGYDEVQDALSDVLSVASGRSKPAAFSPMSDDNSSVQSYGADADSCIEASDSSHDAPPELSHMMHRLLNNADVQRAVMGALHDSPELEGLLSAGQLEHIQPLYSSQLLLPAVASTALEHHPAEQENAVQQGLKAVENGLEAAATAVFGVLAAIGANIAGAGDGLGRLLSRLAAEARAALQGNAAAGAKEGAVEAEAAAGSADGGSSRRSRRRSVLTGTLFTVAVAIISMIIFKRARLVRIVRT